VCTICYIFSVNTVKSEQTSEQQNDCCCIPVNFLVIFRTQISKFQSACATYFNPLPHFTYMCDDVYVNFTRRFLFFEVGWLVGLSVTVKFVWCVGGCLAACLAGAVYLYKCTLFHLPQHFLLSL